MALSSRMRTLLLAIPRFVLLLFRLMRDPRVAAADRAILGSAALYALTPLDLIPDFLPVAGQLDDLFLLALAIDRLIRRAGPDLVLEHWDGSAETLDLLCGSLEDLSRRLPGEVRKRLSAAVQDR